MLSVLIPYIDSFFSQFTEKLGLAQQTTESTDTETKRYPSIFISNGNSKQIDIEKNISYHRLRDTKTIEYTENNTGGCTKGIALTYPLYFIGSIKNDCQYSNDQLSNKLANQLAVINFPKPIRRQIKAWNIEIQVVEINVDNNSVFEQEYTNIKQNTDDGLLYFSISYNIIVNADSSCLALDCENISPSPICDPSTITLNGESFLVVNSGSHQDIILQNQNLEPIIPQSVVNNIITVDTGADEIDIKRTDNSIIISTDEDFTVPDSTVNVKNSIGNSVDMVQVMADSSADAIAPDANYILKNSADAELSSGQIPSNESQDIIAPDGHAIIKNTLGNQVNDGFIPSGGSADIEAPDGEVQLKDTDGNNIGSVQNIVSGEAANIIAPDAIAIAKRSDNTTISSTNILSNQIENISIPDSTARLVNTASQVLSNTPILADSGINLITAPDSVVNLNGVSFLSPKSNETVNVLLKDQNGTTIVPASVVGPQINLNIDYNTLIRFDFVATSEFSSIVTIISGVNAGTYTAITNDGAGGTITFSKNGGAFVAFSSPLVLANGDTIRVKRTIISAAGFSQITGTY